jgi:hypothetical protein
MQQQPRCDTLLQTKIYKMTKATLPYALGEALAEMSVIFSDNSIAERLIAEGIIITFTFWFHMRNS